MSDDEELEDGNEESAKYSQEQKIVAAVWVHEREFNHQTWRDLSTNFLARFGEKCPTRNTLRRWEKKLFTVGNMEESEKSGRPLSRLMHVPYVRASLREAPDLSVRERSKVLGLPGATLRRIIKEDLNMEYEVDVDGRSDVKKKHAPYGGGRWKVKEDNKETVVIKPAPSDED